MEAILEGRQEFMGGLHEAFRSAISLRVAEEIIHWEVGEEYLKEREQYVLRFCRRKRDRMAGAQYVRGREVGHDI